MGGSLLKRTGRLSEREKFPLRLISMTLFSLLVCLPMLYSCKGKPDSGTRGEIQTGSDQPVSFTTQIERIRVNNIGSLAQVFNDSNLVQLEAAKKLGITPVTDLRSAYFIERPIVKISSNDNYKVDSLVHSLPYLVPEAASLLDRIGANFRDSLKARGGAPHLIRVTSLLRTPETVSRLRKVNVNATDSSTHRYGTTFDISYVNFQSLEPNRQIDQGDLKNLLAEVLLDLRKEGVCYVKFEKKTGCFHITATR